MAAISAIRQTVAAAVTALDGMNESPLHPQAFARTPDSIQHGAFAVDLPATSETGTRQRDHVLLRDELVVRFWARVVPSKQRESFDAALDLEVSVRGAVCATNGTAPDQFHALYQRSARELNPAGDYQLVTLNFITVHYATP